MRINKNDQVLVTSGDYRGKEGRVIEVDREAGKVKIEGINIVHKHVRRSRRNPQGGRLSMEMPLAISNVQLLCPSCKKATRTGAKIAADGVKYRTCKKCGVDINRISSPKKK